MELKGGSFFTIVPTDEQKRHCVPEWYSGNIYNVDCAPPHLVNFPTVPSAVSPTVYHLYISGDYEVLNPHFSFLVTRSLRCAVQIRLFGDPKTGGSEAPTLVASVNARFESPSMPIRRETPYDVAPDFVEGFAFGDALGVGLRCLSTSSWTVTALSPSHELREAVRMKRTCRATGRLTYPVLI